MKGMNVRYCPSCGQEGSLKESTKHGDKGARYEIGWDEKREKVKQEGEALIYRCSDCGVKFILDSL